MRSGLYSRETVAAWLGKKVEELERMIEEDGFPAIGLPTSKHTRHKFSANQICGWLNKRSKVRWTVEEVIAELDRCTPNQEMAALQGKLERVTELRALCDAAEKALQEGRDCPRVVGAILQAAEELKGEVCAA